MRCWENYRNKRKIVKALIREEKMKLIEKKIKEQGVVGCKLFWSDLKGRSGNKSKICKLQNEQGEMMDEKDDILGVLADHWEGLGKQDESCEAIDGGIGGRVDEGCEQVRIRYDAVLGIVQKLKKGKAVGPDDEMLKFGGGRVVQTLCDVLGEVVSKGSVPDV